MTVVAEPTHRPAGVAEVVAAHRLVADLFTPRPWCFWRERVVAAAAWAAFALLVNAETPASVALWGS